MPRALISGITGQDGWYLSELLAGEGFAVFGLATHDDTAPLPPGAERLVGDMRSSASLEAALSACEPDVVFNLASVSSVSESWLRPELVGDVNGLGAVRLLAAIRESGRATRFVQASSAEIFGNAPPPQSEATPVRPVTPYGAAKAYAHLSVGAYRDAGLWAAAAILYNHESPRRPERFVTRKITSTVARIADGSDELLVLGNLAARRDWGYAGDYMRAMVAMASQDEPDDYVIATGESHSVADFAAAAFASVGIADWASRVRTDPEFERATDAVDQRGDSSKARRELGWTPALDFAGLVGLMVDADRAALTSR